jgi:hypothetical protein
MDIRRHPRFKGRFFTFRSTYFVDQENRSKQSFLVYSSGRREVVKRYLWLKLVHDQLTRIEYDLFINLLKESDDKIWSFLKLLVFTPKKLLRDRLLRTETKLGQEASTRESYRGSQQLNIEIQKETRRLPKTKKFSGYIRSLASRGKTKLGTGRIELPSITIPDFKDEINLSIFWESQLAAPSLESFPEQEE